MDSLKDSSIDLILADLPYGTTKCKWDVIIPFEPLWKQYKRVLKKNGAVLLFGSQPFTSKLIMSNLRWFKYEWIWEKERPTNIYTIKNRAGKVHENILVFMGELGTYNPQMMKALQPRNNDQTKNQSQQGDLNIVKQFDWVAKYSDTYNPKERYPRSVIKFSRGTRSTKRIHPTQKPVPLLEYFIKTYSNEGEIVLDNVMGSGSTGVACINTNRNFVGIELDKNYFEIAKKRIEEAKIEKASRLF